MGAHGWSTTYLGFIVCGFLALFCGEFVLQAEAGCRERESPNCCTGRNNECFEYTRRKTVCYCDTYCQKTRDCCEDYQSVCQISAIDCVVGSWGPWSSCTSSCGVGSTERSRQVSVPPRNGGTPCPDLKQRRGCFGNNAICSTAKEVAKILPNSFKRNFKDPWRRPHMLMKEEKASYCVHLQVKQASMACRFKLWTADLVSKKDTVCVECQSDAMAKSDRCGGDGIESTRTFWSAASVPGCHGSWVRQHSSERCRCPLNSFLFV